jgi:hypothetical protein
MRTLGVILLLLAAACGTKTTPAGSADVQMDTSDVQTDSSDVQTDTSDVQTDSSDVQTDTSDVQMDTSDVQTDSSDVQTDSSDVQTDTSDVQTDASDVQTDAPDSQTDASCTGTPPGTCCCDGDIAGNIVCKGGTWACTTGSFYSGEQCDGSKCGGPCSLPCPMGCCGPASNSCTTSVGKPGECVHAGVTGTCKDPTELKPGQCWTSADCGPATCQGANVCPCGAACLVADKPGTCTDG